MTTYDKRLTQSILKTITYSDHFNFPLTQEELYPRLISAQATKSEFRKQLSFLLKTGEIIQTDPYYHLPLRSEVVTNRLRNETTSLPKLNLVRRYTQVLSRVPGVVSLYLTGSLAVRNAQESADLDFMIITQSGRLWTTRLLVTLITSMLGIRRTSNKEKSHNSNLLCLNLYLTETSLTLPSSRRSLYTAYELVQAMPVYDPEDTHTHLLSANSWLQHYLPNFSLPPHQAKKYPKTPSLFERFLYFIQYHYMRRKITHEYITPTQAFFHPRDPGHKIITKLNLTLT